MWKFNEKSAPEFVKKEGMWQNLNVIYFLTIQIMTYTILRNIHTLINIAYESHACEGYQSTDSCSIGFLENQIKSNGTESMNKDLQTIKNSNLTLKEQEEYMKMVVETARMKRELWEQNQWLWITVREGWTDPESTQINLKQIKNNYEQIRKMYNEYKIQEGAPTSIKKPEEVKPNIPTWE